MASCATSWAHSSGAEDPGAASARPRLTALPLATILHRSAVLRILFAQILNRTWRRAQRGDRRLATVMLNFPDVTPDPKPASSLRDLMSDVKPGERRKERKEEGLFAFF